MSAAGYDGLTKEGMARAYDMEMKKRMQYMNMLYDTKSENSMYR